MKLNFYDFENIISHYADILEERKKEEEEDARKHGYDESKYDPNNMMKQAQKSMPTPKMPNINIPKF